MFQITKEWLEVFRTDRGGYTMDQVRCLGYPDGFKTKNLKKKSIGMWITDNAKLQFQELSNNTVTKAENKRQKKLKAKQAKEAYVNRESVGEFRSPMTTDFIKSDEFLKTFDWLQLRMRTLHKFGNRCSCCGATPSDGAKICVDHIKSRKFYPHLALDQTNLQVLCGDCNFGKGNSYVDWRET